jgi:hypothetical protein
MKLRMFVAAAAAAGLTVGATAAAGLSASGPDAPRLARYDFVGHLLAAPGSSTSIQVHVQSGNRLALRKMLGAGQDQSFTVGAKTEYLRWNNGVPSVVQESDLAAGDVVAVHVRAPRSASLTDIEATAAGIVGDRGPSPSHANQPLYLFAGKLTAVGSNSITVDVKTGNRRALRLLIGQSSSESFTFDQDTTFLVWKGKVPSVILANQLTVGDRIIVRVRAAKGSTLAQVESTPAVRIAEHERAGS